MKSAFCQADIDEIEARIWAANDRLEKLESEFQEKCASNGGSIDIDARAEINRLRAEVVALEARRYSMVQSADVDAHVANDDYLDDGMDMDDVMGGGY